MGPENDGERQVIMVGEPASQMHAVVDSWECGDPTKAALHAQVDVKEAERALGLLRRVLTRAVAKVPRDERKMFGELRRLIK